MVVCLRFGACWKVLEKVEDPPGPLGGGGRVGAVGGAKLGDVRCQQIGREGL